MNLEHTDTTTASIVVLEQRDTQSFGSVVNLLFCFTTSRNRIFDPRECLLRGVFNEVEWLIVGRNIVLSRATIEEEPHMKNLECRSFTAVVTTKTPGIVYVVCFEKHTTYVDNTESVYATVK